ncbi:hypothetical protein AOLI_G00330590 [Acnodon oligacanthus]
MAKVPQTPEIQPRPFKQTKDTEPQQHSTTALTGRMQQWKRHRRTIPQTYTTLPISRPVTRSLRGCCCAIGQIPETRSHDPVVKLTGKKGRRAAEEKKRQANKKQRQACGKKEQNSQKDRSKVPKRAATTPPNSTVHAERDGTLEKMSTGTTVKQ